MPDLLIADETQRTGRVWRWSRLGLVGLVLFAVVDYWLLPQLAGLEQTVAALSRVRPWWAALVAVLEVVSVVSYSRLSLRLLPGGHRFSWLLRADVSGLGMSHLVPAGSAAGNALRYRLLRQAGASPEAAAVGVTVETVGSSLVLLSLVWLAVLAALVTHGPRPAYLSAAIAGGAAALTVVALGHPGGRRLLHAAGLRALRVAPARLRAPLLRTATTFAEVMGELASDRRVLVGCVLWSSLNWLCDAAALWCALASFGARIDPLGVLIAYGVASSIGSLPLTPGGLGLVEGALVPGLIAVGAPSTAAVLGVLGWRLVQFWLPIPAAGGCYLSLRAEARRAGAVRPEHPRVRPVDRASRAGGGGSRQPPPT